MAKSKPSWGIQVLDGELRLVRVEPHGSTVKATDFAVIPFTQPLSKGLTAEQRDDIVAQALATVQSKNRPTKERVVIGAAAERSFCRFAKLPPVTPNKIPDITKFEAMQQIPFALDQVEWDYDVLTTPDEPDVSVVIAAMTKDRVAALAGAFKRGKINPVALVPEPIAVYNAMVHMRQERTSEVWVYVGLTSTDVIIAHDGQFWARNFPISEQQLAEKESVRTEFVDQADRSVRYFNSLFRGFAPSKVVVFGSATRTPGVMDLLGRKLNSQVVDSSEFKSTMTASLNPGGTKGDVDRMIVAFGLGLQGTGLAQINVDLLPEKTGMAAVMEFITG